MREKAHLKSIVIPVFLAAIVLSAAASNQAFGITYKAIDLNPSGFSQSYARGTNGTQQVGCGYGSAGKHALLWNGSADNFIDLNPSGFHNSYAYGISGTQQVGMGDYHALLWSGTAASYVDLNPSGFTWSWANGTSGTQQVGYGWGPATGKANHALLWNGSADSYIDLHQFLPVGFGNSYATAIDGYGNIIGYARDSSGNAHAILWQVPEPATLLLLGFGAVVFKKTKK
jgi:hypothetical protein